jgi:metal-responsive CopG/Arc/MetJ family transcriptional regulator
MEYNSGYTESMKTAVSIPDPLFKAAERAAKRQKVSRSRFYAEALHEYLERRRSKAITKALNEIYRTEPSELDPVLARLQSEAIDREDW